MPIRYRSNPYESMQADGAISANRTFDPAQVTDAAYRRAAQSAPTG